MLARPQQETAPTALYPLTIACGGVAAGHRVAIGSPEGKHPACQIRHHIYIYWAHLTGRGVCAHRKSLQASGVAEADLLELDENSLAELVGMAPLACRVAIKHEIQAIKEVPRAPM
jgi:hypothetical protein